MAAPSKRMASLKEKVADKDPVSVKEAVELLKSFSGLKFDQSVEIAMRLGIDPKQADQIIRGSIVLPHGIGRTKRVVVFAKGAAAESRGMNLSSCTSVWERIVETLPESPDEIRSRRHRGRARH